MKATSDIATEKNMLVTEIMLGRDIIGGYPFQCAML